MQIVTDMAYMYSWATREYCFYRLSYDQLLVFWRDGRINLKKEAMRIAGHMCGVDIDAVSNGSQKETGGPDRDWFRSEFGMDYEDLKRPGGQ